MHLFWSHVLGFYPLSVCLLIIWQVVNLCCHPVLYHPSTKRGRRIKSPPDHQLFQAQICYPERRPFA